MQSGKSVTYTDLPAEEYRKALQQAGLAEHIVELVEADVAIATAPSTSSRVN